MLSIMKGLTCLSEELEHFLKARGALEDFRSEVTRSGLCFKTATVALVCKWLRGIFSDRRWQGLNQDSDSGDRTGWI